mgnify:CR=1 FL=1|jgi:hypothetical protein
MDNTKQSPKVHIDDLHFEHMLWVKELKFFKDELDFFRGRLEEVAKRYTTAEVLKGIEHFQNQFYIQGNNVDTLMHDINLHESKIAQFAESHPIAIDHVLFTDHSPLRDRVETNRDILHDLKKEYQRYLAKWL